MVKQIKFFLVLILCLFLLAGCGKTYTAEDITGKVFTYEKDGFGGAFTIKIYEDGTFQYYVGLLSSYIGIGEWSVEDGILTLEDYDLDFINHFRIGENTLTYLAVDSTNFMYLTVEDGDRFFGESLEDYTEQFMPYFSSYFGGAGKTKFLVSLDEIRTLLLTNPDSKTDRVKELLEGFTHEELKQYWGQPDSMTSGLWSYSWNLDETCSIGVFFDADGYVSEVRLRIKD